MTKVVNEKANPQVTPPTSKANGIVRIINAKYSDAKSALMDCIKVCI